MPSGAAAYRVTDVAPLVRADDHGRETRNATTRIYRIDEDSAETASMHIQRDIEVGRGEWRTSTHVEAVIRSDATTFSSEISLIAKRDGEAMVKRTFTSETPRFPGPPDSTG
jgi:hypothetical protein